MIKITQRKDLKNFNIPALNIEREQKVFISLRNKTVNAEQPESLEDGFWNTLITFNNTVYLVNSIDLDFIQEE